uniref:Alpha-carbonic anhydrase domain-containing protein n=1 Tax=Graphocephala atropunctata TaxID=36148 RepID=A0A1B6MLQ1_9HEMI
MYHSTSRMQPLSHSSHQKQVSAVQRVQQASDKDGEKLSPIDLSIREATLVQLPPLNWAHYYTTPSSMTVMNTGFTVMIHAKYEEEMPFVSSGPLVDEYVFSQIHFHWGEHNETGSGHAVDGIRYPLEMHVIHLKKGYDSLVEALESKDGIAVMVHLFALREERNNQLDQLTAVLQFIQRSKCCARLCPTPLSEIVHPFTSDYFLYWGAVGSPKGQYRILWFISRNVLPISAQQLNEFRQLYDPDGNLLLTNSSKPQPLSGRSLFLVSPSERTNITMHGISRQAAQSEMYLGSDESIDIRNAEYKSLAALEDNEYENCKVCSGPKRLKHTANINVGYPFKVNEGDTSVEESCIDLVDHADNSGVTVKTEMKYKDNSKGQKVITNVNVTTCKHNCNARYSPMEAVYSIISTRGSELHLKRKPNIVRQAEPSVEQACMMLSSHSSTHRTYSAPSLTSTGGHITAKQEHTDLSHLPVTHFSSEMAVTNRDSDVAIKKRGNGKLKPHKEQIQAVLPHFNEFEYETTHKEISKSTRKSKKVTIQGFEGPGGKNNPEYKKDQNDPVRDSRTENIKTPIIPKQSFFDQPNLTSKNNYGYCGSEKVNRTAQEEAQKSHILVHQIQNKKPYYKVVGEFPTLKSYQLGAVEDITNHKNEHIQNTYTGQTLLKKGKNDSKATEKQRVIDPKKTNLEFYQDMYSEKDVEEKTKKELYYKENIPFYPVPSSHNTHNHPSNPQKENKRPQQKINESNPHCRVSLVVRTTVSDHRKPGHKKENNKVPTYTVTKISPVDRRKYKSTKTSDSDIGKCYGKKQTPEVMENLYYAKPIIDNDQKDPNREEYPENNNTLQSFKEEYYENSMEKEHKKTQVVVKEYQSGKSIPKNGTQQLYSNRKVNEPKQLPSEQGLSLPKTSLREAEQPGFVINTDTKIKEKPGELVKNLPATIDKEEITNSNLTKKINVYHGKNEPDEHIRIVDKTITGTIGKSQSTEVIFQSKHIETVSPQKTDSEKQINYSLVKSKHPELQVDIKPPPNETEPSTVIYQNLSLDQQIKGQAQIRHKVEYHNSKKLKTKEVVPSENPIQDKQDKPTESNKFHGVTETYEESSHEQSLAHHKFKKQIFKNYQLALQNHDENLSKNTQINNNPNQYGAEQERQNLQEHNSINPNKMLTEASIDPATESISQLKENSMTECNKVTTKTQESTGTALKINDFENPPQNKALISDDYDQSKYNSYSYEEYDSVNKHLERTKNKKKIMYEKHGPPEMNFEEQPDNNASFPKSFSPKPITQRVVDSKIPSNLQVSGHREGAVAQLSPQTILTNDQNKLPQNEFEFEEILEEQNEVRTTKKIREKTTTVRGKEETSYKLPSQLPVCKKPSSHYAITIDKIEIPGPRYVTRIPKPPLVEYVAYPVDPQQPYEIMTETLEEISSTVTENKTFMMFKRIYGKPVLNQPSAKELEQVETEPTKKQDQVSNPGIKSNNVGSAERKGPESVVLSEEDQRGNIQREQIQSPNPGIVVQKLGTTKKQENNKQISNNINQEPVRMYEQYEYSDTSSTSKKYYSRKEKKINCENKLDVEENNTSSLIDEEKPSQIVTSKKSNFPEVQDPKNYQIISTEREEIAQEKSSQRKIKIVVGSYMQQKSSLISSPVIIPKGDQDKSIVNSIPLPQDNAKNKDGQFIYEEYYESVTEEEKQKSAQKHFVVFSGVKDPSQPGPSHEYRIPKYEKPKDFIKQDSKYPEIEEEPTKDTSMNKIGSCSSEGGGMFQIVSSSEENDTSKTKTQTLKKNLVQRGYPQQEVQTSSVPIDKNDGDIVIYIRQPRIKQEHHSPKITVDISDGHQMTTEELSAQKVRVHESKNRTKKQKAGIKPINPRKSKSADIYRTPITGDSSESDVIVSTSDSNEQVLDTTHYNLTLKSVTKVDLEEGQNPQVKSRAEVKIKPLTRTLPEHVSTQEKKAMVDECCSAIKITEVHESSSNTTSCLVDTSEYNVGVNGVNHSPIKIDTQAAVAQKYPQLQFHNQWNARGDALLVNNGKTLRVSLLKSTSLPYLQGGPFVGDYVFYEMHFHWGIKDCCGTEHVIDGQRYAVEAHFLYFKREYENLQEAMTYSDGIAVVAINLTIGGPVNPQFAELVKDIRLLREADSGTYVPAVAIFTWMKPAIDSAKGYFCYKGSLTNSPQSIDNATWLVFPEPILFCCQQIKRCRNPKLLKKQL